MMMMGVGIAVCVVWMKYASPKGKNPHSRPEYHPPSPPHHTRDVPMILDPGIEEHELGGEPGVSSDHMYSDMHDPPLRDWPQYAFTNELEVSPMLSLRQMEAYPIMTQRP